VSHTDSASSRPPLKLAARLDNWEAERSVYISQIDDDDDDDDVSNMSHTLSIYIYYWGRGVVVKSNERGGFY
jgi:hypothetical protein